MKKKNKVTAIIISLILITAAIALGVTLASFSSKDSVKNNFLVGSIKTEINENFDPVTGYKEVWTENPIDTDSLVRVSINVRLFDPNNPQEVKAIDMEKIKLNFMDNYSDYWYKGNDGYYYYKKVLKGTKEGAYEKSRTESLLKSVEISRDYKETIKDMEIKIDVKSEAVQATKIVFQDEHGMKTKYAFEDNWIKINDNVLQNILKEAVDKNY
ncbi:hypothetical protein ACTNDG_09195 [Clostridium sp. HCP1S3_B4]|uniref:hypothetical protein n=1 Tax=unclassified Clostridium TaxID=2614128 RepID=UPI0016948F0F|nr:hypothetical protein [Clostridiales bacterium]MDY2729450.1 hypothetical protein [Clostridium sp.]NLK23448.1 hypothetical protein [Clostridiales bacterium]